MSIDRNSKAYTEAFARALGYLTPEALAQAVALADERATAFVSGTCADCDAERPCKGVHPLGLVHDAVACSDTKRIDFANGSSILVKPLAEGEKIRGTGSSYHYTYIDEDHAAREDLTSGDEHTYTRDRLPQE